MSLQAGVFYPGRRPVSDDAGAILKLVVDGNHRTPLRWSNPGVLLVHAETPSSRTVVADGQPHVMGEVAITFDGRLDNRVGLRLLLGHEAEGADNDAALALATFIRFGPDGLERLIGDWSLAIFDRRSNRLVLASDFAGARPLYYHYDAERIVWSTRLRALIDWIQPRGLNEEYVAGFLAHGGYPDLTPHPGVNSVRPGHYLIYSDGRVELSRFWCPPMGGMVRYQCESDYEERLRELFRHAVGSRLDTDAPVIAELSGGLDSSSIVSMAKYLIRGGSATPSSFATLSYYHEGSRDKRFYEWVADWSGFPRIHLSTAEHTFVSESDTGDALPAFWSRLHTAVAAEARKLGARTLLTGNPGDMIMGNWQDDSAQIAGLIREGEIRRALRESLAWSKVLRRPAGGVLWRALLLLLPAPTIGSRLDLFSEAGTPTAQHDDSIAVPFRARMDLAAGPRFSAAWLEARPERMKHVRGLLETIELRHLQAPEPLVHLYYTHPYAHRPLVEYMLSIPAHIVCRPGEPRRLMRRAFQTFWAPALNGRRSKDSFAGVFLAALRPLASALMADVNRLQLVQRGYVDAVNLKARLERLVQSLDCNEGQLRRLILLELWLRRAADKWSL